jgi:hypothetical protein
MSLRVRERILDEEAMAWVKESLQVFVVGERVGIVVT